jgi:hypothetical protein
VAPGTEQPGAQTLAALLTLANLSKMLQSLTVDPADHSLRGIKTRLTSSIKELLLRCAAAALDRCRHPVSGKYRIQTAMQLLTGDDALTPTNAKRVLNEILERNRNSPISQEDIKTLLRNFGFKDDLMNKSSDISLKNV